MVTMECPRCEKYVGDVEPPCVEGIATIVVDCPYCEYTR